LLGPIETRQGFHLVKVEEKRQTENGEDEIKARQILVKVEASSDTRDEIYNQAYNFSQEVTERGFDQAVKDLGMEVDTTREFSEAGYIAGLGRMRMAAEFCFNNPVGTASPVFNIPDGYVVFKIVLAVEEGTKPFEDVKSTARKQLERIVKKNKAWNMANDLLAKINTLPTWMWSPLKQDSCACQR
jgi:parvulin-like peptidyl-prolyl isomerase